MTGLKKVASKRMESKLMSDRGTIRVMPRPRKASTDALVEGVGIECSR
jgi:hypothetical protein